MRVSRKQYILIHSRYRSAPSLPPATTSTAALRYHPCHFVVVSVLIIVLLLRRRLVLCHHCAIVVALSLLCLVVVVVALLLMRHCCCVNVMCANSREGRACEQKGGGGAPCLMCPRCARNQEGGRCPGRDCLQMGEGGCSSCTSAVCAKGRAAGVAQLVNGGGYLRRIRNKRGVAPSLLRWRACVRCGNRKRRRAEGLPAMERGTDPPRPFGTHTKGDGRQVRRGSNGRGWLRAVGEWKGRWGTGPPSPPPCVQQGSVRGV
jgi:hypothetical protein